MTSISQNIFGSKGRRSSIVWGTSSALLLFPFVAMRFTDDVRWDRADFVAAAGLLLVLGVIIELTFKLLHRTLTRAAVIGMASVTVMLIWADAAVGVF